MERSGMTQRLDWAKPAWFKNFTTKAEKAHEGREKRWNPALCDPLSAFAVYFLLFCFHLYLAI
jgi:hypothetical protein